MRVMGDPREAARRKFAGPRQWSGFDLLARCATDPPLAIATLLDAVRPPRAGAKLCELGFGEGWLLHEIAGVYPEARLYGLDQSASRVAIARASLGDRAQIVRGDMEALPFADGAFDVIVTCWTLYFMADIDAALAGMKRCIRRGGRFVAATVAPDHMIEHEEMLRGAMGAALGREPEPDIGWRFDLDTGAKHVAQVFDNVDLPVEWSGELLVPDVETALQLFAAYPPDGLTQAELPRVRDAYRGIAEARLREGPIRVRRHDGAFIADID
jgi:SAM-dependent methyltransferase